MILPVSLTGRLMGKQKDAIRSRRWHMEANRGIPWGRHVLGREEREWKGPCQVPLSPFPSLGQGFFPGKPIKGQVCLSNYAMRPPALCLDGDTAHQWNRPAGEFPLVFRKMFICLKCPFTVLGCELSRPPKLWFLPNKTHSSVAVYKPPRCAREGERGTDIYHVQGGSENINI